MPIDFPTFRKAALIVVRDLLTQDFNRAEIEKAATPAQKLKAAIGLGGGHTLGDECPPYFLFSYKPNLQLKLTRETPSAQRPHPHPLPYPNPRKRSPNLQALWMKAGKLMICLSKM